MNNAMDILTESDVRVPMRDGVRMAAHVFRPNVEGRFPGSCCARHTTVEVRI